MRVNYAGRNTAKEEKWEGNVKLSSVLRRDSTRREARGMAVFDCPRKEHPHLLLAQQSPA